jgi:hypothetical protein
MNSSGSSDPNIQNELTQANLSTLPIEPGVSENNSNQKVDEGKLRKRDIEKIESIDAKEEDLWDEVGIHKTLGGSFFRNFTFMLIGALISVATVTFVLGQLIPYVNSKGYYDISQNLFSFVFMIFDVGTAYGIERFIAEYMVKDKRKMMKYVQFYVWYQCFTGLIQVTLLSYYILTYIPQGNLAYLGWILLIINIKQYPGMLGTFDTCIRGFQRYDKSIIIGFIGSQGFQFLTQIIFFIGGRYWGMANPQIGELLGLSIGMVLGYYIDDFFSMWLAYHYFGIIVQEFGFEKRDAWGHDFDWPIIKECLKYGIGISWAPLIGVGIGFFQLTMSLNIVPGYSTWIVLSGLGGGIGASINMGDINITSPLAESINNGKKELTNFYLSQAFKYWAFIGFAMGAIIVVLLPIVGVVLNILPEVAQQYQSSLIFIIPGMIAMLPDVPMKHFDRVLAAAGKVWIKSSTELICNFMNIGVWYYFIYIEIWNFGTIGIIILFILGGFPSKLFKFFVYLIYIEKKIVKIRISWWQTFGASICTFFVVFAVGYIFVYFGFMPMLYYNMGQMGAEVGAIVTAIIGLLVILFGFMIFVFPLSYALFGGWDEFGLEVLRKSYLLSGPSKPFIKWLYFFSVKGSKISPLYNKHKIPFQKAFDEAKELLALKHADQQSLDKEKKDGGKINIK